MSVILVSLDVVVVAVEDCSGICSGLDERHREVVIQLIVVVDECQVIKLQAAIAVYVAGMAMITACHMGPCPHKRTYRHEWASMTVQPY